MYSSVRNSLFPALLALSLASCGRSKPTLTLTYNTDASHKRIAAAVQEMWRKKAGVKVELRNEEWKVFIDKVDSGNFQIARRGWAGEYLDPHAFLDLFRRDSGSNPTGWSSDAFEGLMDRAEAEADPARRRTLLAEAEKILLDEAPCIPVFHYISHNLVKPFVKGAWSNPRDLHPLQGVTLEGEGAPEDGVLILNGGAEPGSLDPALSHDLGGLKILMHLFEGLAAPSPRDAHPVPAAAEGWEVSKDGLKWTFHLRPARWSNGDPLTAADFVYAWRRVVDPSTASTYAHRMFVIRHGREIARGERKPPDLGVRAVDERTLEVDLVHPAPYFPDLLCLNLYFPVHRATVERHGVKWTRPENMVHNGPYRMVEWRLNDRKVFAKNPRYRDAAGVKLAKFVLLAVADANAAYALYEAGQCHWIFQVPPDFVEPARRRPDYLGGPFNAVYFYVFNTRVAPLDDAAFRRKLSDAVDRRRIVESIKKGGEQPAFRLVPATANPAPLPR